jgi:hypothetical protein
MVTLRGDQRPPQYSSLKDPANRSTCGTGRAAQSRAAASVILAEAHAARLDGTTRYRIVARGTGCCGGSRHNSPAGRRKIRERRRLCDSPRICSPPPAPGSAVGRHGRAIGGTGRGVGVGLDRWRDSVDWLATATIGGPPADRPGCNIARADAAAGTAARTLSTGRDVVGNAMGLARETNGDTLKMGPREVLLPKVKPRREAPTSHRGVFMRSSLLLAALRPDRFTLSPVSRPGYRRTGDWLGLRRDPLAARLVHLGRETGTLNHRC